MKKNKTSKSEHAPFSILARLSAEETSDLLDVQKFTKLKQAESIRFAISSTARALRIASQVIEAGDVRVLANAVEIDNYPNPLPKEAKA